MPTQEQLDALLNEGKKQLVPKVSIPEASECKVLFFNAGFTDSGMKRAETAMRNSNLLDGFGVDYAVLSYITGTGKDAKKVELVHYDPVANKITFPGDKVLPDGKVEYAPVTGKMFYTTGRLTSKFNPGGKMNMPSSERLMALLCATSFQYEYSKKDMELLTILINSGVAENKDEVSWASFGLPTPTEKQWPVLTLFRYVDSYYASKDLSNGQPNAGAKKQVNVKLTIYNRELKSPILAQVPTVWLPDDTVQKIFGAIIERKQLKDIQTKKNAPAPATTGFNTPYAGGDETDLPF
jgi:hypothetical protein